MKILNSNVGNMTNFEVLDLLRSRGAGKDPTRVIASVSRFEFQVFDYLEQTAACNQSSEDHSKFLEECKKFELSKAERHNIVNTRPTSEVEICPILENESRMEGKIEELIELLTKVLPPHPSKVEKLNEETAEGKEENGTPEANTE